MATMEELLPGPLNTVIRSAIDYVYSFQSLASTTVVLGMSFDYKFEDPFTNLFGNVIFH